MNTVWGWLFNAPVWIQTPLVVVFLVLLSGALAYVVMKVMSWIFPPSVAERDMIAEQPDRGCGEREPIDSAKRSANRDS